MLRKRDAVQFEWQLTDAEIAALKRDTRLGRYVGRLEGRGSDEAAHTGRRKLLASLRLDRQIAEEIDRLEKREGELGTREALEKELEDAKKLAQDRAMAIRASEVRIQELQRQRDAALAAPAMAADGEPTGR